MNQAQLQDFLKNKTYGTPPEEEQDAPLEPSIEEVSPLEPPVKPDVSPERLPPRDRAREWSDSPQFPHGGRYRAGAVSPYGHELGADIDSSEQGRYSQSLAELTKSDDSDWDQRMVASFRESWDTRKQLTSAWDEVFALPGLIAPTSGLFLDKIIKGEDEPLRIGFPNARDMVQLLGEAQIALGMEAENGLLSGAPLGMILPLGARANRALGGGDFFGDETPMWDTAVQFYRERYDFTQPGWAEAFGEVLATDMAGVIGDFAAAASLAGLSAKGASVASKAAARASRQLGIKMDGRLAKVGWVSEKLASKAEKFGELAEGFNRRMNQSMVSPEQLFSIAKAPGVLRALGRFGRRWGAADMELATLPFVAAAELWRMKLKRAGEVPIDVGLQDLMLSQRKLEGVEMQMRADEPPNVEQLSPDELRDELASVRQESDSIREQLEVIEDDTIAGELRNTLAGLDERRNQINARLTNPVTDEVVQDIETTVVEAGEQIEQARDTVDIDANTTEYSNRMIEILEGLGRNIDEQGQQVIEQAIQEARGTGQVSDESLFQIGRLGESLTVEVVDAIRQAFESEGRPTEWLDNLSIHAYGDIQRGLEESARLGEVDPESAFPPVHQAYSYERLQQWDDMEQAARQAVEKDSTDVYAQAALGRALTHKGQFDEAIEVFDNLITNNPDDAYAHISRAETKRKTGDTEGADADIERAEEIQFGDPSEDTMSVDDARREFGEKVGAEERELTAEGATFRGLNHFKAGRYSQAIARAEEAVRLDPNNVLAHGILGYSYYGKGRASRRTGNMEESNTFFEDAANSFRKALEIEPDNVYSLNGMAWYHYRKGQHSQARYYREQARLAESGERMAGRGVAEIESELAEVQSTLQDLENRVTALEDSPDVEQLRAQADNLESELAEARLQESGRGEQPTEGSSGLEQLLNELEQEQPNPDRVGAAATTEELGTTDAIEIERLGGTPEARLHVEFRRRLSTLIEDQETIIRNTRDTLESNEVSLDPEIIEARLQNMEERLQEFQDMRGSMEERWDSLNTETDPAIRLQVYEELYADLDTILGSTMWYERRATGSGDETRGRRERLRTGFDELTRPLREELQSRHADTEDALTLLDEAEITIELNDEGQKVARYQGLDEDGNPHEVTTTFDADMPDDEVRQRTQELIDAEKQSYQQALDEGDEAEPPPDEPPPDDDIPFGDEAARQPSQLPLNQVEEFYQFLLDKAKDVDDPMLNEYIQALDGLTEDIVQGLAEIDPRIEGITDAFEDAKQIVGNKATFDYLDFIRNTLGNDVTDAPRYSNVVNQLMENIDSPENVQRILEQLSENDIDRFRGVVLQNMWERWADGGADDLAKLNENGQLEALLGTGIANSIRMWDEIVEDYIRPDPRPETAPDRPPEPETVADENLPRTPEGELPRRPEDILPEDKLLPHEEVAEHRLNIKRRRKAIVEAARSRIIEMLASIRNSFVYRASLGISAGIVGLGAYQGAGWLIAGGAFALVNAAALEAIVYIADKRNLRKSIREGVPHVEDAIQRGKGEPAIINLLDMLLNDAKRQNILPSLRILKESSQIREDEDEEQEGNIFGEFAR